MLGGRKAELERWAREHLEPGTTVKSDGLASAGSAGCRHEATVTGGGPGLLETPGLVWVNTVLVKRSIGSYHSIKPKYLARYLNSNTASIALDLEVCCERQRRRCSLPHPLHPPIPLLAAARTSPGGAGPLLGLTHCRPCSEEHLARRADRMAGVPWDVLERGSRHWQLDSDSEAFMPARERKRTQSTGIAEVEACIFRR